MVGLISLAGAEQTNQNKFSKTCNDGDGDGDGNGYSKRDGYHDDQDSDLASILYWY